MSELDLNKFQEEMESKLEEMEKRLYEVENSFLKAKLLSELDKISTKEGIDVFIIMLKFISLPEFIFKEIEQTAVNKKNSFHNKSVEEKGKLIENTVAEHSMKNDQEISSKKTTPEYKSIF